MLLGISSSNININTLKMVLLLVHFVDGDIISDFGLGSWWGPSGAILVRSIEDSTKTVLSIRIEPWWEEGALPVLGLKGFVIPANPPNACTDVDSPPAPLAEDLNYFTNEEEGTFFLLTKKDNDCDYETQIQNANKSGYAGIIIRNTGLDSPEKSLQNFSFYSIFPCSVGESDGILLQNNFSYPLLYFATIQDKRSTHFHNIIEIVILVLVILIGIVSTILICTGVSWCIKRIKDCIYERRIVRRVKLLNATVSSLPIRKWTRELDMLSEENKICRVCRENFKDEEEIRILPCSHIFHLICIDQWIIEGRAYCNICRYMLLPPDERFVPSDISDSGEFTLVISSEVSPLLHPGGSEHIRPPENGNGGSNRLQQPVALPPETFDASFDSVLHPPIPQNRRKRKDALQKQGTSGESEVETDDEDDDYELVDETSQSPTGLKHSRNASTPRPLGLRVLNEERRDNQDLSENA